MANTRYVKQNSAGSWDVLKDGDRRAAIHAATRSLAVARAKRIVSREGGGEVHVMNSVGKIEASTRVPRGRVNTSGRAA